MRLQSPNKQSGLALITVLFIFALVSMLAISMQQRQSMDVAQASITFAQAQAQILALSVEDIAKAGLSFDLQRDINSKEEWDTASELWNARFPIKLDDAEIIIDIRDLQGLFNLNSLHPKVANSTAALARFQRLLTEIETSAGINIDSNVAQNVRNWLTKGHSANYDYQNETPPYRASEIEFAHPSELKLVKGVDNETYLFIEPYITALPSSVALNINTTDPKILSSWDPTLTTSQSESLVNSGKCGSDRNTAVYKDVDEFWQTSEMASVTGKKTNPAGQWNKEDFTVKSEYFSVFIQIKLDDKDLVSESIIRREPSTNNNSGFIGVIYRDLSRTNEDMKRLKIVKCTL